MTPLAEQPFVTWIGITMVAMALVSAAILLFSRLLYPKVKPWPGGKQGKFRWGLDMDLKANCSCYILGATGIDPCCARHFPTKERIAELEARNV